MDSNEKIDLAIKARKEKIIKLEADMKKMLEHKKAILSEIDRLKTKKANGFSRNLLNELEKSGVPLTPDTLHNILKTLKGTVQTSAPEDEVTSSQLEKTEKAPAMKSEAE